MGLSAGHRPNRSIAQGLFGCADACAEVGLTDLAVSLYRSAHEMADAQGYHDLRFWEDFKQPKGRKRVSLDVGADEVRRSVLELAPEGVSSKRILVPR